MNLITTNLVYQAGLVASSVSAFLVSFQWPWTKLSVYSTTAVLRATPFGIPLNAFTENVDHLTDILVSGFKIRCFAKIMSGEVRYFLLPTTSSLATYLQFFHLGCYNFNAIRSEFSRAYHVVILFRSPSSFFLAQSSALYQ
jgi:hypothetical protein